MIQVGVLVGWLLAKVGLVYSALKPGPRTTDQLAAFFGLMFAVIMLGSGCVSLGAHIRDRVDSVAERYIGWALILMGVGLVVVTGDSLHPSMAINSGIASGDYSAVSWTGSWELWSGLACFALGKGLLLGR